jgi:hypothetical protein
MKPIPNCLEMLLREDKRKWILNHEQEGLEGLHSQNKRPNYLSYKDLKLRKLK